MKEKNDHNKDPSRLAVAIFIVATTLTIMATNFQIPTEFIIPIAALLMGLILTAIFAFLYILAKGYELRYGKKKDNVIDRYNYILYNFAMTAYVIVVGIILLGFIYKYLNDSSKAGNPWATAEIVLIFIGIIAIVNRRDIKELYLAIRKSLKESKAKRK
jgi:MFS family permease